VLHCATLCFTVLHCASLCFTVLHCASLCFTVLHCVSLCVTVCRCVSLCFKSSHVLFRVKCANTKKSIVRRSEWRTGNESALLENESFVCLNTTNYDKDIADYMCTPQCPKPDMVLTDLARKNMDQIDNNWADNATYPQVGDQATFFCQNKYNIVSLAHFTTGEDGKDMANLTATCTMSGKYDFGKSYLIIM
jgi:hypothetical protein